MSELDVLLRESLGRLAEPGNPAGVAEAIRMRVESAGSSGGNSPGSGGSGAGSVGSGFWGGWAPLGILIGLSVAGGAGLALATQHAADGGAAPFLPLSLPTNAGIPASACPGGPAVTTLDPGARLLALSQSEDGAYYAVRDPQALGTIVWVAVDVTIVDPSQDPEALPVSGCYEASDVVPIVTEAPPEPEPAPQPEPGPAPRPGPGGGGSTPPPAPTDSQKPTIQVGNWSPSNEICYTGPSNITVWASDNVGVASVVGSSSTPGLSAGSPSVSGNAYTFTVTYSGAYVGNTTVLFTVKDAAGNTVTLSSPTVYVYGTCLI